MNRTRGKIVPLFILLLGLSLLPPFLPAYSLSLLTQILIFGIFAASLDLLVGYAGLFSLGHAAFWGTGAYTIKILYNQGFAENFFLLFLSAVLMVVIIAVIFGFFATRMSGIYFLMITLCFSQVLFAIAWKWKRVTGGDDGLPGIFRPVLGISWDLVNDLNFYYFSLAIFLISIWVMFRIVGSPFCKALEGIRESESRMQALGFNTRMYKFCCYVVSAFFSGVGGILSAYYYGLVSPYDFSLILSGEGLMMNIIGGIGTLWGPLIGAAVFTLLKHLVSGYTLHWPLIVGGVFILAVMFVRGGIAGYLRKKWKLYE
jgi:branched-chain amino acid transport system permease protein